MDPSSPDTSCSMNCELKDCIKELDFSNISFIIANPNATYHDILVHVTNRVPLCFSDQAHICARVTIGPMVIETANYKPCIFRIETPIMAGGESLGTLEAGYTGAVSHETFPLTDDDTKLLKAMANRIGIIARSNILKTSLERSEKKYRTLLDNALVGITQTTLNGEMLYANAKAVSMFGFESPEQAMTVNPLSRFRNPRDRETLMKTLQEAGTVTNLEVEFTTTNGDPIFVLFSATLEGDIITGMMMDITERRRVDDSLVKSEQRLVEAQRVARVGSWDWDIVTGNLYWSDYTYHMFGFLPREFAATYEAFLGFVHPEERQTVEEAVKQSLSDPKCPYSMEHTIVLPDSSVRWVHELGEVTFDRNGLPVRMIGTVQDITDRKMAEEALQKAFAEIKKLKDQLEAENVYLHEDVDFLQGYGDIIGQSDAIRYVVHRIRQVTRTKTTVLLTGETGSGKGIFARFLHRESDRRDRPFVNVNCAGLPANLIESELFGREKGAFTGSTARQIGRFELAHTGTIFLDEIGELPIELQAKLLKVIEEGEFERLGSPHPVKVDVRIIASTNRNLEEEIRKGSFRQDLYFRLSVFPVTIPPLRQREGDVPLLVKFFTEKFARSHHKTIEKIPAKLMTSLEHYPWPGNVREMINVIERAVIVTDGPKLRLADRIDQVMQVPVVEAVPPAPKSREIKALEEAERDYILKVVRETGWRIEGAKGAARLLGMNPSTLRTRMKKLGIKRPTAG